MPVVKLYHHGLTGGISPVRKNHSPSLRGDIYGWSATAAKRNIRFLRSVRLDSLTGKAFALTLTIRDCPDTSKDWASLRNAFIERLRRRGMLRMHWVTEWQRRGVPHLHGIVFFSEDSVVTRFDVVEQWLQVAKKYVCSPKAQYINDVTDTIGWFKYLSKHASRGHLHYQRCLSSIPKGWLKTGRVWGYVGDWKTDSEIRLEMSNQAYFRFRRIVRAWRIADARSNPVKTPIGEIPDVKRIKSAKTMLKCSDYGKSSLRGVSEWISMDVALLIIGYLYSCGYEIEN